MSAHVVPKAPVPFGGVGGGGGEEEEDKTTIESGWEEDEASTTVEQGEAADRIRALAARNQAPPAVEPRSNGHITSTNSVIDEPTVDDRHGNLAIQHPVLAPPGLRARLVITHGNDTGQSIDVVPGKSYTVGRAIDNDFVLTDIAVSRKHFDLRHEGGSWLLADRGSGNGTIVNGQIEDQPFMLANGDVIEIGNTTFRFEQQNVASTRTNNGTYDVDLEEEEPSTVAGKPLRSGEDLPTPAHIAMPVRARPKTQPPPTPPTARRTHAASAPPPFGRAPTGMPAPTSVPIPVSSLGSAPQPIMPRPESVPHGGIMSTTMSGPGPISAPLGSMPPGMAQPQMLNAQYPYPVANMSDRHPMHVAPGGLRDATSTAHVSPTPYGGVQHAGPYSLGPTISKRTKLLIGGAALALVAAIVTVAVVGGGEDATIAKSEKPGDTDEGDNKTKTVEGVVTPIDDDKQPDDKKPEPKPDPKPEPKPEVAITKPEAKDPKPEPEVEKKRPEPEPKAEIKEPTIPEKKPEVAVKPEPKPDPKPERVVEKKPERDKKPEKKPERVVEKKPDPKPDPKPEKIEKPSKKTDVAGVKKQADSLYRSKKFNEAAAALKAAASGAADDDSRELRSLAGVYEQLGRAYNVGMAPGTKKVEAFTALQTAQNMDRNAGGAFGDEIRSKLAQVAPQAAIALAAAKNYEKAFLAVRVAESLGNKSGDTKTVRDILESAAGRLYGEAAKEIDSSPDAAKAKLRQIKGMVESSSPWYAKANKLLSAS